jgi:eukaryotic-like serine/threonine-protein kinase
MKAPQSSEKPGDSAEWDRGRSDIVPRMPARASSATSVFTGVAMPAFSPSGVISGQPPRAFDGKRTHVPEGLAPTPNWDAPLPPDAPPEVRIGQYEIIRELGRGGMGVVYLARDTWLGRRVAVKLLQTASPELTRRFIVEARATASCNHENIVVIHEVGEHEGSPFMVLEYLQGQTLAAALERSGPMQPARAVEVMVAVVRALVFAHEQKIVHRDLKPENIFITDSGTVKVLDFGIAKVLREDAWSPDFQPDSESSEPAPQSAAFNDPSRTGIVGTLAYMSPEQWITGGHVDHRSDIWSTGIILFQMLTGVHPLQAVASELDKWVTRLEQPMPSLHQAQSRDIAPELADVVDRCLRKVRDQRFPDAITLLKALEPFLPGRFMPGFQFDKGPYAGLRAFQEENAGCFFGRSREVAAMVMRIQDGPLTAVVGPSGVGKSSFVRAGVVPALRISGMAWQVLVARPGRAPLLSLASLLSPLMSSSTNVEDDIGAQREVGQRLVFEPGYLGSILRSISRRTGQRFLLFVDQFEELYTLCSNADQRRAFTTALAGAADDATSPVRVIISIRADFLGRVAEDAHFMAEVSRGLFFLGPPGPEGLREALVHPAEMCGYRFETRGMVEEMIHHLEASPGALPLLQFTASELWDRRDAGHKLLTVESYRAFGGISGALANHADAVVGKLTPAARALCRTVFLQLVTAERTRAVRELAELRDLASNADELNQVLDGLVESRLLIVQTGGGSGDATVELVHESLIESWLTLRRWLEESHEDSVFLEQLRAAARQWQTKGKDSGLLWGGEMAEELARFQRRFRGELSENAQAFARAVATHRVRRARLKRVLALAAVALAIALLAAAAVALLVISRSQRTAEKNAVVAQRAQLEAQRRLREVEEKEKERKLAEVGRTAAEKKEAQANSQVALTSEELAEKNIELTAALRHAEEQGLAARTAQGAAERNEREAREAKDHAQRAAKDIEQLLKKERDRANRLSKQLGSPVLEELK